MIKLEELSFSYRKSQVLSGLNLQLEPGAVCGLLGENGAGKTTLLHLIAGLLSPDGGSCEINGMKSQERRIGFLQQLYFVSEEILNPKQMPTTYLKQHVPFYPNFNTRLFQRAVDEFNIDLNMSLNRMSFGTRKKFFLSFAFAASTSVLLMDEPTNGLDIPSKSIFRKLVAETIDDSRIIIISTHQVRDLENIIDPIVILSSHGVLLNAGTCDIEEKLHFAFTKKEIEDSLYVEKVPGGRLVVTDRKLDCDECKLTDVQLELLFNAVVKNPKRVQALFQPEDKYE